MIFSASVARWPAVLLIEYFVLIIFLLKPEKSRSTKLSTAVDNFVRNYFHVYLNLSTR